MTLDKVHSGRRFEYRYDGLGNRTTAGPTGNTYGPDDHYWINSLNEYTQKENNTVKVLGNPIPVSPE